MKRWFLSGSLSIVAVSIIVGCGGGGSGGAEPTAKLTDENIEKLGKSVANAMPGCVYVAATGVSFAEEELVLLKTISDDMRSKKIFAKIPEKQKSEVSRTENGSCGGTLHIAGTHDNGDDDLTYTYSNYCMGDENGDKTVLNGSARVVKDGTPSDSGPILDAVSVSTQGDGVTAENTEEGVTKTSTVSINNFSWTKDGTTKVTELKVASGGKTYTVNGVNAEYDEDDGTLEVKSATYTDPEVGTVSIMTGKMSDGAPASITVKGAEGEATFESTSRSPKKFMATNAEGTPIGAIDCSGVDNPLSE